MHIINNNCLHLENHINNNNLLIYMLSAILNTDIFSTVASLGCRGWGGGQTYHLWGVRAYKGV